MDEALDEEIIGEFLGESFELLDELDRQFVALEEDPGSTKRLDAIFRGAHTIKGTSGLLGFHRLEAVTHAAENVLVKLRDGALRMTPEITSVLLKSVDATREMLRRIEGTRSEGDGEYPELIAALKAILDSSGKAPARAAAAAAPAATPAAATPAAATPPAATPAAATPPAATPPAVSVPAMRPPVPRAPETLMGEAPEISWAGEASGHSRAPSGRPSQQPQDSAHGADAVPASSGSGGSSGDHPHHLEAPSGGDGDGRGRRTNTASDDPVAGRELNVRVGISLLDRLMNLVGELVLARNQVVQASARTDDATLLASSQRLNLITTELQEGIMKTRMQAIGSVWTKFPRIVRDLGISCGKQVRLELIGKDTELDRTVIEAIRDPLTHLVRNSVDHGLETPEQRVKVGKPAAGLIVFRAFHEGGMVNIEVSDDGGGIDPVKIRAKAVERNLISPERAARLSEREALQLVFLPGFSTAAQVTNVSGRGVGMDVVKTSVEKIGGTVDILSRVGEGTSIRVKIPLTLAIIPALIVQEFNTDDGFMIKARRYAIPQVNLVELVRVESSAGIEYLRNTPVYRLRGKLLPLVFLRDIFREQKFDAGNEEFNIVVLQADNRHFGLVVDEVNDTQEIVVKPLGRELKSISAFAGATIMGDGRVALILDVFGIAAAAGLSAGDSEAALEADDTVGESDEAQSLLVFNLQDDQRMAMPLDIVDRLEEFRTDQIERAGGQPVIQYRDKILRLVDTGEVVGNPGPPTDKDVLQVVVHSRNGQALGLVVDHIADIVQERIVLDPSVRRPGVLGATILQGNVTESLDVDAAWQLVYAQHGSPNAEAY